MDQEPSGSEIRHLFNFMAHSQSFTKFRLLREKFQKFVHEKL